jgi:hypothetical protein
MSNYLGLGGGGTTGYYADGKNATKTALLAQRGLLYSMVVSNINATGKWILLYDALAADVTVGTTAPSRKFYVPAGDAVEYGVLFIDRNVSPMKFSTGIMYACVDDFDGSTFSGTGLNITAEYIKG